MTARQKVIKQGLNLARRVDMFLADADMHRLTLLMLKPQAVDGKFNRTGSITDFWTCTHATYHTTVL